MVQPRSDEPRREILERSPGWWARPLLNRVPRWLFMAAALLAGGGTVLITGQARPARVTPAAQTAPISAACAEFTNLSGISIPAGFRVILGDGAVPPAYLGPQQRGAGSGPFRFGWKTGFSFRGGGLPVTISVPAAWRGRLALFGPSSNGFGTVSRLRLPGCPRKGAWNTYVSAFFLHTPSGCVPLDVAVGRRAATVWFGLGRHCPASLLTGRS